MVTTDATSSAITSATTQSAMKQAAGLDKDDFLLLFIKQLQNQDPLNPQDSSEFIAQLAQLTQVEQSYNANDNLTKLLSAMDSAQNYSSVSYLGKAVEALGDMVNVTSGKTAQVGFNLANAAKEVTISISDSSGNVVRTLSRGYTAAGEQSITWDGLDGKGKAVPSGTYSWTVKAAAADGSPVTADPLIYGKVDAVRLVSGSPVLTVGGIDIPLANVVQVSEE